MASIRWKPLKNTGFWSIIVISAYLIVKFGKVHFPKAVGVVLTQKNAQIPK